MLEKAIAQKGPLWMNRKYQKDLSSRSTSSPAVWKGTFTFMPKRPEIKVGGKKIIAKQLKMVITLFSIEKYKKV
jgi:hypothetical protein